MAMMPTQQEIDDFADSIGYEPLFRGDSEAVREYVNKVTGSDRIPRNQMAQRAAVYYEKIDEERAEIAERPEPTAVQLKKFLMELISIGAPFTDMYRNTEIVAAVAQGLVSQQGLILEEKETAQ